jgi:hypothetical protein
MVAAGEVVGAGLSGDVSSLHAVRIKAQLNSKLVIMVNLNTSRVLLSYKCRKHMISEQSSARSQADSIL